MSEVNGQQVIGNDGKTGDVGGTVPTQVVTGAQVQQGTQPVQQFHNTQSVFTQEQLNSIIQSRVNPLNTKITELSNQLANANQMAQSYLNELNGYKNREEATKAGVLPQFVDFAIFEAQKLAVNGKGFSDALKEYVQANPHFTTTGQIVSQPSQHNTPEGGQVTQVVANPAQGNQQPTVNTANAGVTNGVVNKNGLGGLGEVVTQPAQMLYPNSGVVTGQVVQFGGTGVGVATAPSSISQVDAQVDTFLKERGLKK